MCAHLILVFKTKPVCVYVSTIKNGIHKPVRVVVWTVFPQSNTVGADETRLWFSEWTKIHHKRNHQSEGKGKFEYTHLNWLAVWMHTL